MKRRSPTFSAPGAGFVEGGFPTDPGGEDRFGVTLQSAHPGSLTRAVHSGSNATTGVTGQGSGGHARPGAAADTEGAVAA